MARSRAGIFAAAAAAILGLLFWGCLSRRPQRAPSQEIRWLALHAATKRLAAGSTESEIRLCAFGAARTCYRFAAEGALNDPRFSPRGELARADRNIRLVAADRAEIVTILGDGANYGTVRFDAAGAQFLTIDGRGTVKTVDRRNGRVSAVVCCSSIWGEVDYWGQGQQVIGAGHFRRERRTMAFGPLAIDAVQGRV